MNKIDEHIINEYLTCGQTYDNYIFCNCPSFVMNFAYQNLAQQTNQLIPVNILISRADEENIEKTINQSSNTTHRQLLYRDYLISLIIREIYKNSENKNTEIEELTEVISALTSGDLEKAKESHSKSPMPYEISMLSRKIGKIELNIFLNNTQNEELQRVINNLIYSREPYSIKLFTNNEKLLSYCTQNGEFIECPHDYTRIDINKYITTLTHDEM